MADFAELSPHDQDLDLALVLRFVHGPPEPEVESSLPTLPSWTSTNDGRGRGGVAGTSVLDGADGAAKCCETTVVRRSQQEAGPEVAAAGDWAGKARR